MKKDNKTNNDVYKTLLRSITMNPTKIRGWTQGPQNGSSSCTTCGTHRGTLVNEIRICVYDIMDFLI